MRARKQVRALRVEKGCFPRLFAALTGRLGHGLARMAAGSPAYSLGL